MPRGGRGDGVCWPGGGTSRSYRSRSPERSRRSRTPERRYRHTRSRTPEGGRRYSRSPRGRSYSRSRSPESRGRSYVDGHGPSCKPAVHAVHPGARAGAVKTRLCCRWEQARLADGQACSYAACTFAHGPSELRRPGGSGGAAARQGGAAPTVPTATLVGQQEECRHFRANRWCSWGFKCHRLHDGRAPMASDPTSGPPRPVVARPRSVVQECFAFRDRGWCRDGGRCTRLHAGRAARASDPTTMAATRRAPAPTLKPPPPPPADLPSGWTQYADSDSGRSYYVHGGTGVTQWDKP